MNNVKVVRGLENIGLVNMIVSYLGAPIIYFHSLYS